MMQDELIDRLEKIIKEKFYNGPLVGSARRLGEALMEEFPMLAEKNDE